MKNVLRIISQVAFLAIFIFLILQAKMNIWLILFGVTLIAALFWGRIYCSWICPINTVMRPINWLVKKIGYRRIGVPRILKSRILPWIMLILMAAAVLASRVARINIPVLIILLGLGAVLTFVFQPEVFHKYICPYGALQGLLGKAALNSYKVDPNKCDGCRICQAVCEAEAITMTDKKAYIDKSFCLQCGVCQQNCPRQAISYGKTRT
ncbi:MAG: 4Fe-4S binding protein [Actinomycetota bacterium]|jgi:polyferredoxin|nr:4Fe-4S binding protein [Actinomycetota bacterium]